MKNIFKLMGIALIASSMLLVSCNKEDEPEPTPTPTPTPEKTYTLTLKVNDGAMGSIAAVPQKEAYKKGDTVVVTATANQGYKFVSWENGDKENPRTIVFDEANITVTAGFAVQVPDHATVTFGENTWTATTIGAGTLGGKFTFILWEQYGANDKPLFRIMGGSEVGTFVCDAYQQGNQYTSYYWNYPDESWDYDGDAYPIWFGNQWTQTITEFDMNDKYMVFELAGDLYNAQAWNEDEEDITQNIAVSFAGHWQSLGSKGLLR